MNIPIEEICREVEKLDQSACRLEAYSKEIPALKSNLQRIKAGIAMLKINFNEPRTHSKSPN